LLYDAQIVSLLGSGVTTVGLALFASSTRWRSISTTSKRQPPTRRYDTIVVPTAEGIPHAM